MTVLLNQPILIVEDSQVDFEATVWSLEKVGLPNPIYRCEDGDDALDYLYKRGGYTNSTTAPRPGIILLDLNLPGTDGREVLVEVKQNDGLKSIPIIILSTSIDPRDINACYCSGANCYVQKPVGLDGYQRVMQRIREFWFEIAMVPSSSN